MNWNAKRVFVTPAMCALLAVSGCNTVGYYFQAIDGHLEVMRRSTSFEDAIADPSAKQSLRVQLDRITRMRDFASRELALPDNGSFRRYADLGRPYVVWNVFAAQELSVRGAESCFPFAGCVPYRGFYIEADARAYARQLADAGFDTYLGGVPAYSTLGWFDDPVLSTFVGFVEEEVARILFHELAHQVAYVRDDTQFNESFAVAVELEGVRRWLERKGEAQAGEEKQRWLASQRRRAEFIALMIHHRSILAELYASAASAAKKRDGKLRQFDNLKLDFEALKKNWGGFTGYDRYFAQGANNALLASIAVYADYVPAFSALITNHRGDMSAFYSEVRRLAQMEEHARTAYLQTVVGGSVP